MDFEKIVRQRKMTRQKYITNKQIPEELIVSSRMLIHSTPQRSSYSINAPMFFYHW